MGRRFLVFFAALALGAACGSGGWLWNNDCARSTCTVCAQDSDCGAQLDCCTQTASCRHLSDYVPLQSCAACTPPREEMKTCRCVEGRCQF